jgi:hypothetical protein
VAGGGGEPKPSPGGRSGETPPRQLREAGVVVRWSWRRGLPRQERLPPRQPQHRHRRRHPPPPPPPPAPAPRREEEAAAAAGSSRPPMRREPRSEIEIFYGTNRARPTACSRLSTVKWDSPRACQPNSFYTGDPARRDESHPDDLEVGRFKVSSRRTIKGGSSNARRCYNRVAPRRPGAGRVISELSSFGTDYDAWVRAVQGTRQARRLHLRARLQHELRVCRAPGRTIGVRPRNRP